MRAATFASILAISMAGVACSEKSPADAGQAGASTETAQSETPQFNLRYPGSSSQTTSSPGTGEFNLRTPGSATAQPTGPRLPEGAVRDNALSDVPEINTPNLQPGPAGPDAPAEEPDDDIIRLD
ncbi:hypothetical protein [Henriciella aquimarina]|uniref:hypothetical protein n=1 Tax=Henriciella aquimarina TaxID=545261 RepID=UPI00117B66C1|nr:hypothetical protein [Henriciella aquimarina]